MRYSKYSKNYRWGIAVERFPKTAKTLHTVYNTGFHKWYDNITGSYDVSCVLGVYRIIISIPKPFATSHGDSWR